jgi:hypothetical protein
MTASSRFIRVILFLGVLVLFVIDPAPSHGTSAPGQRGQSAPAQPAVASAGVRHLSIPAAAFVPATDYFSYENHGRYLKHLAGTPAQETGYYVAPVLLPQGAILSRLTFQYRDMEAGQAAATLARHSHDTGGSTLMTSVLSSDTWTPGFGSDSSTVFNPTSLIDNSLYSYHVHLTLPPGGAIWGCGVEIDYFPPAYSPASGVLSVPPAAFAPFEDGYAYTDAGWNLVHNGGAPLPANRGWYLAPVHLPHGATVTRMVFRWMRVDTTSQTGTAKLQRTLLGANTYQEMAVASSAAGTGTYMSSSGDTTVDHPLIDNASYAYWIVLDLPAASLPEPHVEAREVDIEFQIPTTSSRQVSVAAAAFHPYEDGYDYEDHGRYLFHKSGPGGSPSNGWYLAPLHLPDGATVRKMTFYWYSNGTSTGAARLQRTELGQGTYEDLASAFAPAASATNGSSYDDSVLGGPVDNSRYAYWIAWDLPAGATSTLGVHGQAVVIDYGFQAFLPLVRRQ